MRCRSILCLLLAACLAQRTRGQGAAPTVQPLSTGGAAAPAARRDWWVTDAVAEEEGSARSRTLQPELLSREAEEEEFGAPAPDVATTMLPQGASLQRTASAETSPLSPPPPKPPPPAPPSPPFEVVTAQEAPPPERGGRPSRKLERDAADALLEAQIAASQAAAALSRAQAAASIASMGAQPRAVTSTPTVAGGTPAITVTVTISGPGLAGAAATTGGGATATSSLDTGALPPAVPLTFSGDGQGGGFGFGGGFAPAPSSPSSCAPLWGQCGGANWAGATCCAAAGAQCVPFESGYAQCKPCNAVGEQWCVHALARSFAACCVVHDITHACLVLQWRHAAGEQHAVGGARAADVLRGGLVLQALQRQLLGLPEVAEECRASRATTMRCCNTTVILLMFGSGQVRLVLVASVGLARSPRMSTSVARLLSAASSAAAAAATRSRRRRQRTR
jgi:hypothetical protein